MTDTTTDDEICTDAGRHRAAMLGFSLWFAAGAVAAFGGFEPHGIGLMAFAIAAGWIIDPYPPDLTEREPEGA